MRLLKLVNELKHVLNTIGDCDVTISIANPDAKEDEQQYLVGEPAFIVPEEVDGDEHGLFTEVQIRDWPY